MISVEVIALQNYKADKVFEVVYVCNNMSLTASISNLGKTTLK
jgi:hypothetical protein